MSGKTKYKQKLIDKVHELRSYGMTANRIGHDLKLTTSTVNYILYKKQPSLPKEGNLEVIKGGRKTMDELYADADKAVKEADSVLKRVKRLLFGG